MILFHREHEDQNYFLAVGSLAPGRAYQVVMMEAKDFEQLAKYILRDPARAADWALEMAQNQVPVKLPRKGDLN